MDAKFERLVKKTNISRKKNAVSQNEFIRTEECKPMKTDDPEALSATEVCKMKKLSKRRTLLFIPSFRKKSIKLFREDSAQPDTSKLPKDSDSGRDSDSVISGDSKTDSLSIRSSLSSLDSGIGSTSNSSSSLMSRALTDIPDVICEESRGRAPIASPEDDSMLEDPSGDSRVDSPTDVMNGEISREDNSASSFHTLSDSCSCDSCDDSCSDSDNSVRADNSSDSDSDLGSTIRTITPTSQRSSSTDSDSDIDECSSFLRQDKCFPPTASLKSRNSIVHTNSVNRGNRIKTNGSVIKKDSRQQLVTPLPTYARSHHAKFFPTVHNSSKIVSNTSSAFKSFNSSNDSFVDSVSSSGTVTSCGSIQRNRISYCEPDVIPKSETRLHHSESERRHRQKLRSPILQVRNKSLNREVLEDATVKIVPDLPPDSSKSLEDVQQSMQNTAYWVSNSRYSSQPDDSATLIKDKSDISERELCKEIIGIYFSEMDSDSSLSSSCLENSLDGEDSTSSSSSSGDSTCLPRTLETNLDDFSTAVYIPAKASEAHTRKISSAKVTKTVSTVKSRSDPRRAAMANSQKGGGLCCKDKPVPKLSEHEVDTITKLHTICNGQRVVQYLNMAESPMVHFPPPKRASRIIWNPDLEDDSLNHHSPRHTPTKPRSVLRQRPEDFTFPFVEDKPSPIVITRVRRSKSMSRASKEWPW